MKWILIGGLAFVAACSSSSSDAPGGGPGGGTGDGGPGYEGGPGEPIHNDGGSDIPADGAVKACSAARASLLGAVTTVSTGEVTVLGSAGGVTTLFVDASAGGTSGGTTNPWIFVDLAGSSRVAVSDTTSIASTAWDLAFKRPVIYTNSGDGGDGRGGAVLVPKAFDAVTAADASAATYATESFFDDQCNPQLDNTGAPATTFSSWYDYNDATHVLSPHAGTWLVRGGTGKLFKVQITTYYGTNDGGTGTAGGKYIMKVGAL